MVQFKVLVVDGFPQHFHLVYWMKELTRKIFAKASKFCHASSPCPESTTKKASKFWQSIPWRAMFKSPMISMIISLKNAWFSWFSMALPSQLRRRSGFLRLLLLDSLPLRQHAVGRRGARLHCAELRTSPSHHWGLLRTKLRWKVYPTWEGVCQNHGPMWNKDWNILPCVKIDWHMFKNLVADRFWGNSTLDDLQKGEAMYCTCVCASRSALCWQVVHRFFIPGWHYSPDGPHKTRSHHSIDMVCRQAYGIWSH